MRYIKIILLLIVPLLLAVIAVLMYWNHFKASPTFSSAEAWGAFGSYIGGTLGPALAYCALLALILTLGNQQESLSLAKKNAEQQWNYLLRKERKDEWRDAIRDANRLLSEHLQEPVRMLTGEITDRGRILHCVAQEILPSGKCNDSAYADTVFAKYTTDVDVSSYKGTSSLVIDIWNLLNGFAENLTEENSRLLSFYISYYQGVTSHLHSVGAISDSYFQHSVGKIMQRLVWKSAEVSPGNNTEK